MLLPGRNKGPKWRKERDTNSDKRRRKKVEKDIDQQRVVRTSKFTFCFHTRKIAFLWSSRNLSESKILYLIRVVFHLRYVLNLAA